MPVTILRRAALATLATPLALASPWARGQKSGLTVASFPDVDRAAQAAVAPWGKAYAQTDIRVVSRQYADHHTAMSTALATGSGLPDVMAIDFRFLGRFVNSGGFEDLAQPPYNALALAPQFVRYSIPQGMSGRGALVAMPADIGPGTLLYRKDLLERAGLVEADLTRDWDSYLGAGKKIKAATGAYLMADAADLRDILLRAGVQDGEGLYFDKSGAALVESPRFVRAFELGLTARRSGLDAQIVAWSNEWAAGFKQSRIATQMMGCWLSGHLKNWLAPQSSGLWRAAPLPGGVFASYGGTFYAIPRKAANKAAAWDFIRFMTTRTDIQMLAMQALGAFPALLAAQHDPVMEEPMPYLGGQRARQLWRETAARVPAITVNKFDAMATDVIRDEFEKVVAEGKGIPAALTDARVLIERRSRRRL